MLQHVSQLTLLLVLLAVPRNPVCSDMMLVMLTHCCLLAEQVLVMLTHCCLLAIQALLMLSHCCLLAEQVLMTDNATRFCLLSNSCHC